MSGTLQLGGTNLAVHSGSGASAKITLDSGLVFPAGHPIGSGFHASSNTRVYIASGQNAIGFTISPTFVSTSNKFLLLGSLGVNLQEDGCYGRFDIEYNGTLLIAYYNAILWDASSNPGSVRMRSQLSIVEYLDVPAVGTIDIDIRGRASNGNIEMQDGSQRSSFFIQEFEV